MLMPERLAEIRALLDHGYGECSDNDVADLLASHDAIAARVRELEGVLERAAISAEVTIRGRAGYESDCLRGIAKDPRAALKESK